MFQAIIVAVLFLCAVAYVGRLLIKHFQANSACDSGCGKCGAVDFAKLESQLKEKGF